MRETGKPAFGLNPLHKRSAASFDKVQPMRVYFSVKRRFRDGVQSAKLTNAKNNLFHDVAPLGLDTKNPPASCGRVITSHAAGNFWKLGVGIDGARPVRAGALSYLRTKGGHL